MAQEINLKFGASLSGGAKAVFTSLANGLKEVAKGMKIVAKEQLKLGNKEAANTLNITAKALNKLGKELKTGVKDNKKYAKSQNEVIKSGGKLQSVFKKLGTSMQTYARYMVSSNIMLSIIGGFKAGATAVMEYDQALHDLKAITQASTAGTLLLGASIVKVATLTKFSMGEVAGAMKKLGQAGFTATEITGMIGGIAELATGSLESLDVTVKLVSTAIRVFGMDVSKTAAVVDIFANAVTKSRLTVTGLSTTFNYIGPIAAATGLSLKDTSAAMMLLANSGLRFSTIGTGLRRIIGGLAKPSGKFKEAILAAGYSLADFNPNLTDFRDILTKIPDVVKDSTDAIEFFGYRGSSVISAFSTQGVKEYDRLRKSVDRVGTTTEMAAEQMKGLQNALKNISDRFGVLAKTLAEGGILTIFKGIVDAIRSLLSVLIYLSGTVIGQVVVSMGVLIGVFTIATAAILAFTSIGIGAILTTWVHAMVAVTAGFTGVGIAAFEASTGVITLSSAFVGLTATVKAFFLSNPIGIALLVITGALVGVLSVVKAFEKSVRDMAMEAEKYSSSLDKTISKMDSYNEAVKKSGEDSKEAKEEALKLREGVLVLAEEYDNIEGPLTNFTKRVDENTGKILSSKSAISELKDILTTEYATAVLEGVAANERLAGSTNKSVEEIKAATEMYAYWKIGLDDFFKSYKKFTKFLFGLTFDDDPLNIGDINVGLAELDRLKGRINDKDSDAIEKNKKLREGGEALLTLLENKGLTEEKLSKMTNDQIIQEVLGIENITKAQRLSVAALVELLKHKRDFYSPEIAKFNKEEKILAITKEAYKAFGLTLDGVSVKLNAWMTDFKNLKAVTGEHAVSTETLVQSFEKVGDAVKTAADFKLFFKAMTELKNHTGMTKQDLLNLAAITKKAMDNVETFATKMNKKIKETYDKAIDEQTLHIENEKANREKANADLLELSEEYKEDRIAIANELVDELIEIEKEIYQNRKDAENDIASLEMSSKEKIRNINKKGLSDVGQEKSDEIAANKYLRDGVSLLAQAEKEHDTGKLNRGRDLVKLSASIAGGLNNRRLAVQLLNKTLAASKDARNTEAYLKELDLIKKKEDAITKASEDEAALKIAYDKKVAVATISIDEIIKKEDIRHAKEMKNLNDEMEKYKKKFRLINGKVVIEDISSADKTTEAMEKAKVIASEGYKVIEENGVKMFTDLVKKEKQTLNQLDAEIQSAKETLYANVDKEGIRTFSNIKTEGAQVFKDIENMSSDTKKEINTLMDGANEALKEFQNLYSDLDLEEEIVIETDNTELEETVKLIEEIDDSVIETNVDDQKFEKLKQISTELDDIKNKIQDPFKVILEIIGFKELLALQKLLVKLTSKPHVITIIKQYITKGKKAVKKAAGGKLPGFGGGDRREILAEDGEWIINKFAAKKYGDAFMSSLNNMSLPKFANGGKVSSSENSNGNNTSETLIVRFQAGGLEAPITITDSDSRTAIKNMANELTKMRLIYAS